MNRPRQVSDAQICEKAREVFVELGPQAPISAVAERLGVSSAALFKRFGSKEELMLSALSPPALTSLPWFAQLQKGPSAGNAAREQLRGLVLAIGQFMEVHVPQITCLATSGIPPARAATRHNAVPVPLQLQRGLAHFIGQLQVSKQMHEGNAMKMAFSLLGALHMRAFTMQFSVSPNAPETLEEFVDDLLTVLWAGFSPEPRCNASQICAHETSSIGGDE